MTFMHSDRDSAIVTPPLSSQKQYPRNCSFSASDWDVLSNFWYPVAFSRDVKRDCPLAATLLDQRLVLWRTAAGLSIANDLCLHRGVPLSLGSIQNDQLICKYHGFHYNAQGNCTLIPANPQASIPAKLCLKTYPAREAYGLIWTCLGDLAAETSVESSAVQSADPLPDFWEWDDPSYQQILPEAVDIRAAAGRQMEGFLDVAHFAWVHTETFGDRNNPFVPDYQVSTTPRGLTVEYMSLVSNFPKGLERQTPEGFQWRRFFEVFLPFCARLTVDFPEDGRLCILNAASPVSARETRLFCPICRNFDQTLPLEPTYAFNDQVFREDQAVVEAQYPEDLPLNLRDECHIQADQASIAYRKGLSRLGLGDSYRT